MDSPQQKRKKKKFGEEGKYRDRGRENLRITSAIGTANFSPVMQKPDGERSPQSQRGGGGE